MPKKSTIIFAVGPAVGFVILTVFAVWGVFYLQRPGPPKLQTEGPIIAFGDSLIEGVGATEGNDLASVLSERFHVSIVNAGRTGDTTTAGFGRLYSDVLAKDPKLVIFSLGSNDVLFLRSREEMLKNVETMVGRITDNGAHVILLGVRCGIIDDECASAFVEIAEHPQVSLVPAVLDGIIGRPALMADPIHPNDEGYRRMADKIEPVLLELLETVESME